MISMGVVDEAHQELAKPSGAVKGQKTEEIIIFEGDVTGIQFLHTYATVVTLNIKNYNVHHVLVDSGSAVNILYF